MKRFLSVLLVVFMVQFLFGNETQGAVTSGVPQSSGKKEQGWFPSLKFTGLIMLNHLSNISGQDDGLYVNFGLRADFKLDMVLKKHEWRTHFFINEGFSITPSDDHFVKGSDEMVLDSIYLYNISKFWGPFVSFHGDTNLVKGIETYDDPQTFIMPNDTGTNRKQGKDIDVNGSFAPVVLKEVAGLFYRPLERKWLQIELLGGVGGYHYLVREGTLKVDEERDNNFVTLLNRDTFHQLGGEALLEFSGKIIKKTEIEYKLWASLFVPFVYSDTAMSDGYNIGELINYEFGATISLAVAKWLSVDYSFKAEWIPMDDREWKIKNQIMLALTWDAIKDRRDKKDEKK
ncbi:hypothetical protein KAH37_10150 [bacterium]|nr:hypothetical protein [bacterium]